MDKPGYTEGSWTTDCTGRIYVYDPDKDSDVVIGKMYAASDAQLATAAPDLVEALQALRLQALQSTVNDPANEWGAEALQMADAALSKALGKGQDPNG